MTSRRGRWLLNAMVALAMLAMTVSDASAASVLLFDDFDTVTNAEPAGTDTRWRQALDGLGLSVTQVGSLTQFAAGLGGGFDLVVLQLGLITDFSPLTVTALETYLAGGGKIIFSSYMDTYDSVFGVVQSGELVDPTTLSLTMFSDGLTSPLELNPFAVDPPLAISPLARVFETPGGGSSLAVGGMFFEGSPGILVGDGQFIVNAFQGDTFANGSEEILLYQNEVRSLVAVPEPATGALVGTGLLMLAAARRWRKKRATR